MPSISRQVTAELDTDDRGTELRMGGVEHRDNDDPDRAETEKEEQRTWK